MNRGVCTCFYDSCEIKDLMCILEPGDLIEFDRGVYCHWAVYIGKGRVIHRNNDHANTLGHFSATFHSTNISKGVASKGQVVIQSLEDVVRCSKIRINNKFDYDTEPLDADEIMERLFAAMRKDEDPYDLIFNNCEHFAKWARNGKKKSKQIDNVAMGIGISMAAGLGCAILGALLNPEKERNRSYSK